MGDTAFQCTASALYFPPPHKGIVEKPVLSNTGSADAIYKVKTTLPEHFSVKPRMGCLPAGETREIQITCRKEGTPEEQTQAKFQTEIRALSDHERQALDLEKRGQGDRAKAALGAPTDTEDIIQWLWRKAPGNSKKIVLTTDWMTSKSSERNTFQASGGSRGLVQQQKAAPQKSQADMQKEIQRLEEEINTFNAQIKQDGKKITNTVSVPLWMLILACVCSLALGVYLHRNAPDMGKQLQETLLVGRTHYVNLLEGKVELLF